MMRLSLLALFVLAACDDKPTRPDETKFRAMSADDKCRATASRAIMCTDEIMVAELRSITPDDPALAEEIEKQVADDKPIPPKKERKQNIAMHKTSCAGDPGYADAVFACWAIDDCKKFATCVMDKSTRPKSEPR
jgi:hypothetical protein